MKEEFLNIVLNSADEHIKLDKPILFQPHTRIGLVQYIFNARLSQLLEKDWLKVISRRRISNRKHVLLQSNTSQVVDAIQRQVKNAGVAVKIKYENGQVSIKVPSGMVIFSGNALAKYLGVSATWRGAIIGTPIPYAGRSISQYLHFYGENKPVKRELRIKSQNYYSGEQLENKIEAAITKSFGDKSEQHRRIIKKIYSSSLFEKTKQLKRIETIDIQMNILENQLHTKKPILRTLFVDNKVGFFKNIEYKKPATLGEIDHLHFRVRGDQNNRDISVTGQIILTVHIKHA